MKNTYMVANANPYNISCKNVKRTMNNVISIHSAFWDLFIFLDKDKDNGIIFSRKKTYVRSLGACQ